MTNEEAIKYIIRHCNPDYPNGKTEWETAINMAISALKAQDVPDINVGDMVSSIATELPPALTSNCSEIPNSSDMISRQDAISMVHMSLFPRIGLAKKVGDSLMQLPSAQAGIIRCKDCRYYSHGECDSNEMWQNLYGDRDEIDCINRFPDDFCSYAERRVEHGR